MALTSEILRANTALSALTDDQIAAIVTLSANDENSVIAKKTGEIYGGLDADLLAVSGIAKNGTEKTFDYAKRVVSEFKTKAEGISGLQSQIDTLTKEKAKLEKAIAEGTGDAETAKALKQAKADLTSITNQYNDLKGQFDKAKADHLQEIFSMQVDGALKTASAGVKFKAELPESATSVLLAQAIGKIKGMNPEFIDDGKGGKVIVFKDSTGAIMRNPNNQLNPYTADELLVKELDTMGILDKGRQQGGGGTGGNGGNGGNGGQGGQGGSYDISGAKTRVEAYDAIASQLMAKGLTVGSAQFDAEMKQAWTDNNVQALPEK